MYDCTFVAGPIGLVLIDEKSSALGALGGTRVCVGRVLPNTPAASSAVLVGSALLAVNETRVSHTMNKDDVARLISVASRPLTLRFGPAPPVPPPLSAPSRPAPDFFALAHRADRS